MGTENRNAARNAAIALILGAVVVAVGLAFVQQALRGPARVAGGGGTASASGVAANSQPGTAGASTGRAGDESVSLAAPGNADSRAGRSTDASPGLAGGEIAGGSASGAPIAGASGSGSDPFGGAARDAAAGSGSGSPGSTAANGTTGSADVATAGRDAADSGSSASSSEAEDTAPRADVTPTPIVGGMISGRITDSDGQPAPGVQVRIMPLDLGPQAVGLTGWSNPEGQYGVPRVPAGHVAIQLEVSADSLFAAPETRVVVLAAGQDLLHEDFVLPEGDAIEGRVEDESGEALIGAEVTATVRSRQQKLIADADGRFRVRGIPPGDAADTIAASFPGYLPETRQRVTMLEGFQVFRLKRSSDLTLRVAWAMDRTPVTMYVYHLLRKTEVGLYAETGQTQQRVEADDGRTALAGLQSGDWRVEVTVLSPEGAPTDIRGSAQFTLGAQSQGMDISVDIDGGRTISGVVWLNGKGGEPVEGAKLEFIPPNMGFGRFPPPDSPFLVAAKDSDAGGHFAFEGLPPGHYVLTAKKDTYLTPQAVQIEIPFTGDSTPVDIVMMAGGVIHGRILNADGSPVATTFLTLSEQRVNADGWEPRQSVTDVEGRYRIEGIRPGAHYLYVTSSSGDRISRSVDLGPGEEKQEDFDFSGAIEVAGTVTINGEVPLGKISHLMFVASNDVRSDWILVGPDGGYSARLKPETYVVKPFGPMNSQGSTGPIAITETVGPVRRDIDLDILNADVVLVFPSEAQFSTGQTTILARTQGTRYGFIRVNMHQDARQVVSLVGGEYMATFTSRDGQWRGESPWVSVARGNENQFILEMKKALRGAKIGGWAPGELANETAKTVIYDVTPFVQSGGEMEILINYETGTHAVECSAAALLVEGQQADRDDHFGWSGADRFANTYHLTLDEFRPGARYAIAVELRCDGGQNSKGSVYLSMN